MFFPEHIVPIVDRMPDSGENRSGDKWGESRIRNSGRATGRGMSEWKLKEKMMDRI